MPHVNNRGVRIYYEVEGEGSPLVLAHAASQRIERWRQTGYVDALKDDYKLIVFDARGHGRSDKPHEPEAYQFKTMVSDVLAVLDDLNISKAHFWGYSMGAGVGYRAAIQAPERFHSFVLGSTSPYQTETEQKSLKAVVEGFELLGRDPEAYFVSRESAYGRPLTADEKASLRANDAQALVALFGALIADPGIGNDALATITTPCLIYCGDADARYAGAKESASHMPKARLVTLQGVDYTPAWLRLDLVLPHVRQFLAEVSATEERP